MIRQVKFSNFYSFKEEQSISFITSKKRSYAYFQSQAKESQQITKVAGFIGSNASGKTNIMRLFSFLNYFVCVEKRGPNPEIAFKTFFNNKDKSNFYIEFEINGDLYFYDFTVKNNSILKERLAEKKNTKYSQEEVIFSRDRKEIPTLHKDYFKDFPKNSLKNIREDVSLIAFLKASYSIEIINKIFEFFSQIYSNITERGAMNTPIHNMMSIDAYLSDKILKLQMEDFVKKFDIGLESFLIKKDIKSNNEINISISGIHRIGKDEIKDLDFIYESRGTQALFFLLAPVFKALKNNGIVILDELETGLHPIAVKKIIDFFIDENAQGKAQLIFSSHSLEFMKKFDMQQIFLSEKKDKGSSVAYRLDDVKDIRPDENFFAKYMAGAYGSFPDIKV